MFIYKVRQVLIFYSHAPLRRAPSQVHAGDIRRGVHGMHPGTQAKLPLVQCTKIEDFILDFKYWLPACHTGGAHFKPLFLILKNNIISKLQKFLNYFEINILRVSNVYVEFMVYWLNSM